MRTPLRSRWPSCSHIPPRTPAPGGHGTSSYRIAPSSAFSKKRQASSCTSQGDPSGRRYEASRTAAAGPARARASSRRLVSSMRARSLARISMRSCISSWARASCASAAGGDPGDPGASGPAAGARRGADSELLRGCSGGSAGTAELRPPASDPGPLACADARGWVGRGAPRRGECVGPVVRRVSTPQRRQILFDWANRCSIRAFDGRALTGSLGAEAPLSSLKSAGTLETP